ncbi:MAG: tetratricopeptide repeat protein, partial [Pseudomonadota bacterium]
MSEQGTDNELEQLLTAYEQKAEPKSYVQLAEWYLNHDELEKALQVCQKGFADYPEYERGALLYLRILGKSNNLRVAAEIFGNAIAEHPESVRLRLAWARLLLEAGEEAEAKRRAREAVELSPKDPEARTLLAKLGGMAPPLHNSSHSWTDRFAGTKRASETPTPSNVPKRNSNIVVFSQYPKDKDALPESQSDLDKNDPELTSPEQTDPSEISTTTPAPELPKETEPEKKTHSFRPIADPFFVLARAARKQARNARSNRFVLLLLIVSLSVSLIIGHIAFERQQLRQSHKGSARIFKQTISDLEEDYQETKNALSTLLSNFPNDETIHANLALINAHLWSRFSISSEIREEIHMHLGETDRSTPRARAALALLYLGSQEIREAKAAIGSIKEGENDWHYRFVSVLTLLSEGKQKQAEQLLAKELETKPPVPALLHVVARLARLKKEYERSAKALEIGIAASPKHPGLRLEKALLAIDLGQAVEEKTLTELSESLGTSKPLRAAFAVLRSHLAFTKGEWNKAAAAAQEAVQLEPQDEEASFAAAIFQMFPGGNAATALNQLTTAAAARFEQYHPTNPLWRAKALLLIGRVHEASEVLTSIPEKLLSQAQKEQYQFLAVRSAHRKDDVAKLEELCNPNGDIPLVRRIACVEAFCERKQTQSILELTRVEAQHTEI